MKKEEEHGFCHSSRYNAGTADALLHEKSPVAIKTGKLRDIQNVG